MNMTSKILVTGSDGVVGSALAARLEAADIGVVRFDIRHSPPGDILNKDALRRSMEGCTGVVHLGAVSRVIWGEENEEKCRMVNIEGTRNVVESAADMQGGRPWVVFVSSREVYGSKTTSGLVTEDASLEPINTYGRSKLAGERMTLQAREDGISTSVVRLSNVYGGMNDHPTRVVPVFVGNALAGEPLSVEGREHTFDFTYITDAARGLECVVRMMNEGASMPPPIHLATGKAVTLQYLAEIICEKTHSNSPIIQVPPRSFDVDYFVGDPSRAEAILGWKANIDIDEGLERFILAMRRKGS